MLLQEANITQGVLVNVRRESRSALKMLHWDVTANNDHSQMHYHWNICKLWRLDVSYLWREPHRDRLRRISLHLLWTNLICYTKKHDSSCNSLNYWDISGLNANTTSNSGKILQACSITSLVYQPLLSIKNATSLSFRSFVHKISQKHCRSLLRKDMMQGPTLQAPICQGPRTQDSVSLCMSSSFPNNVKFVTA